MDTKEHRGLWCSSSGFLDKQGNCRNPDGCACDVIARLGRERDEAQAEATNIRARLANTEDALRCARDQLAYVLSGPFGTLVEAKLIAKIDAALTEEPSHERSFERPSGY